MKPVITLRIGSEIVPVVSQHLVLELGGCGRGFITALTPADMTGQLVRLDMGYNETVYRWFTGFVERSSPAENGARRLFVRELAGIFDGHWPVSLQHPTLRDVVTGIAQRTDMVFSLPDNADYTDTPIPHFTHSGSGYQLLANLGRAFSISDYTWFQLPDGTIYAGSYAHSRFADAPVEIPTEFIQSAAAGNSITLPVIPAIRPGVVVNGQRITQVRIQDDEMTLTWTPLNSEGKPAQKSPEQRQIDKIYPELSAGLHLPRLARVMGPSDSAALGDQADPFRPRYAVNLQLLDENGEAARNTPVYSAVPLPVPMAGAEGGLFQYPPEGALVEIGFADGRPDKPLIRQTLPEGQALPDIKPGEQLQQQRAGVSQRVTQAGSWQRETDQAIEETSSLRKVSSEQESRTVTERTTVVKANDTATVLGTAKLMAGAVVQLADGDYTAGATGNIVSHCGKDRSASVGQNDNLAVGGSLTEKIQGIRRSVAAAQELLAPSIRLGSEEVNVLSLLTDTLDVLRQLAEQTAQHTHSNTDKPINSQAIADAAAKTEELNKKYAPFIS
ncbi:hypothetical protein M8333_11005 [Klebsiella michiganensis]|uniref:hypothetical protein n=1 Tax=Klebsiella michiganensis TaxID=1134687 RepID=UPI0023AA88FC|nr:hypothetical protein [Klebsiella michiganensis]WEF08806.1 hypothetical protein M8333_11005 [Klebsiella michiganensis]